MFAGLCSFGDRCESIVGQSVEERRDGRERLIRDRGVVDAATGVTSRGRTP